MAIPSQGLPRPHPRQSPRQRGPATNDDYNSHSQLRLKCIVLGSAGAGKTSLLRRFIHGAFEGAVDREAFGSGSSAANHWRRGKSHTSTLGADYYVKKVENPLFDPNSTGSEEQTGRSQYALAQLWDTAGKERVTPQIHPAHWDKKSNFYQFLSIGPSLSTNKTNHEHRYNNWRETGTRTESSDQNDEPIATSHRHNTRQKHGRPLHYHHHNPQRRNSNRPMGDALFRNIDACMLVYDATSSTSFLHLMQWHSEWVQKLNYWEQEKEEDGRKPRRKRMPFIVVANKIDLLDRERVKSQQLPSPPRPKQRRSVMGFRKGYKGQELKYEYTYENATNSNGSNGTQRLKRKSSRQKGSDANYPPKQLTYSLKETLWLPDVFYLRALQYTEDQLMANRAMILLWCERNSIPFFEASALDGRGVADAMNHLLRIGVEELREREREEIEREMHENSVMAESQAVALPQLNLDTNETANETTTVNEEAEEKSLTANSSLAQNGDRATAPVVDPSQYYFLYQPRQDDDLDLFKRYSAKDERRCDPFKCWSSFLSYCER
ncbi:hypothetical protein ACHAWF_003340 [Thalassiosira exigua]